MKLSCDSIALSEALTIVGKALPIKKNLPILNGIKLRAENNTLTVTATDLELSIEKKINAEIRIEGETVVTGKMFNDYVKKIEGEDVILDTTDESQIKLIYGENNGHVQTLEADEYPSFKLVDDENSFVIKKNEFKDIINKIIFCTAAEDSRPTLKGCCIEVKNGKVTGVASDGYRLAYCSKVVDYNGADIRIIVPSRSMNELGKILDDGEEVIKICVERNYFMADLGETKIVTRLIEGEYINYNAIIPKDYTTKILVDKKALDVAIDRASLATRAEKKSMVKLEIREKKINISSESEISSINETVAVELTGHDLNIGFNARYISESLRAIDDDFVKLCFNTSTSPSIIVPTDDKDDYLYLILPVRMTN